MVKISLVRFVWLAGAALISTACETTPSSNTVTTTTTTTTVKKTTTQSVPGPHQTGTNL